MTALPVPCCDKHAGQDTGRDEWSRETFTIDGTTYYRGFLTQLCHPAAKTQRQVASPGPAATPLDVDPADAARRARERIARLRAETGTSR